MDITLNLDKTMRYLLPKGAFLTAKSAQGVNTMTIGWGFVGYMWKKPYFMVMVRPQRYTREFMDAAESFTVSVPFGTMENELRVCGTKSGRDINKAEVVEFIPSKSVDSPVVKGCDMYYECRKTYADPLEGGLMPAQIREGMYQDDYHILYFGEIVECYEREGIK